MVLCVVWGVVLDGTLTEEEFGPRLKWRLNIYRVASLVLHNTGDDWGDHMEEALKIFGDIVPKIEDRDDRFFQRMADVRLQAALHHAAGVTSPKEFLTIVERLFPVKSQRLSLETLNRYSELLAEYKAKVRELAPPLQAGYVVGCFS